MNPVEERFDITGVRTRSAYLFVQLVVLYVAGVFGFSWGLLGLPIAIGAVFLAVYASLRQVEGIVEDKLDE